MKKTMLAAALLLATTGVASAGGEAGSIGLGAEAQFSGLGGISLNYDAGLFHVGGFLSYADPTGPNNTAVEIGGRFFYHLHSTAMSDFGIGGSLGIGSFDNGFLGGGGMAGNGSTTLIVAEPSFQIRLFLASNVALSFTAGIALSLSDDKYVLLSGQSFNGGSDVAGIGLTGGVGVHYYFFGK